MPIQMGKLAISRPQRDQNTTPAQTRKGWTSVACMLAGFGAMIVASGAVSAQDKPTLQSVTDSMTQMTQAVDTLWVLIAAFLVFFMQAGFAYVEGGLTRAKNQNNILMKNLLDFCFGTLAFWAIGFAIMFGDGNGFFGTSGWFLNGADNSPLTGDAYKGVYSAINWTGVPLLAKFMFQLVFAATAATIVSGAMAERTKFKSYLIYSIVISAFIYPVIGHWIWGGGWLAKLGFWDFAGSTVVHSTGGWLALIGAAMLGPRIGKFNKDGSANAIPGHSLPMAGLGVFILWLGWFGFNPGSTMAVSNGSFNNIAHIATTTNIAAACGCITAMIVSWMLFKKPDVSMSLNGALAGLVAITAPCAWVSPSSAAIIGTLAGGIVVGAVLMFDALKTDDPVGAISVHGICGAFGTLSLGLFSQGSIYMPDTAPDGLFFGGGVGLLAVQALGVGAVFAYCAVTGVILFGAIKILVGLRVTEEEELEGLDIGEHGAMAYGYLQIEGMGEGMPAMPAATPTAAPTIATEPTYAGN